MGAVAAILESARQTLRLLLQNRLLRVALLAQVAIALLVFALAGRDQQRVTGRFLYCVVSWWLLGNTLLPMTTMYFGVQAIHGDIEDRTFQYLFLRPVPRWAILLGKWLAVSGLCAAVFVGGTLLVFAAVAARPAMWTDGVEVHLALVFAAAMALSAAAYAAVAALFSARFRWPLVWSVFFIVGLQYLLANVPVRASVRAITIADPVRRFVLGGIDPDQRLAEAFNALPWRDELVGAPLLNLGVIVVVCLLLAAVVYARSEYDSRTRE
jgi:ABC-type transport system involved in multi-copper enzyme maturation permease subunit